MEHTIPETHLDLLQGIYRAVVMAVDPEATFISVSAALERSERQAEEEAQS